MWEGETRHLAHDLGLAHEGELALADAFRQVAAAYKDEPDIWSLCRKLARQCDQHAEQLAPFVARYGEEAPPEPERLHMERFGGTRQGGLGLLRDLHDLYLMANDVDIAWTVINQAAQGARHGALHDRDRHRQRDGDANPLVTDPNEAGGAAGAVGGIMSDIPHHGLQQTIHDRLGIVGDALDEGAAAAVAIAVSGVAAYLFHQPLLFLALGPIAFLCLETPLAPAASPRNTFIGNGVAIVAGYLSLLIFGQLNEPNVLLEGVSLQRAASAAVSVALTVAVLVLLRSTHAPAGATALLISLGFLDTPSELLAIAAGVILLTVVVWIINRILGVPVPVWAAHEGPGWTVAEHR